MKDYVCYRTTRTRANTNTNTNANTNTRVSFAPLRVSGFIVHRRSLFEELSKCRARATGGLSHRHGYYALNALGGVNQIHPPISSLQSPSTPMPLAIVGSLPPPLSSSRKSLHFPERKFLGTTINRCRRRHRLRLRLADPSFRPLKIPLDESLLVLLLIFRGRQKYTY